MTPSRPVWSMGDSARWRTRRRSAAAPPTPGRTTGAGPSPWRRAPGPGLRGGPLPLPVRAQVQQCGLGSGGVCLPPSPPNGGQGIFLSTTRLRLVPPSGRPAGSSRVCRPSVQTLASDCTEGVVSSGLAQRRRRLPLCPQGKSTRPVPGRALVAACPPLCRHGPGCRRAGRFFLPRTQTRMRFAK